MPDFSAFNLKPTHLRLIAAIAEHGQLTVAANIVGISQPGASRMLSEIETIVGSDIFVRHPKGMETTPVGQTMVVRAQTILREMADLKHEIKAMQAGRSGSLKVGAVTGPALARVVPAVKTLKAEAPDADVSVEVAPSRHLLHQLAAGELDFALARFLPEFDSRDFDVSPVREETVSILVRKGHPLLSDKPISLERLVNAEWVMQERGSPIRNAVKDAFGRDGSAPPTDIVSSSSVIFSIAYVLETDAVAALTAEVSRLLRHQSNRGQFEEIKLINPIGISPYFLLKLTRHPLSPVAARLFSLIS